MNRATSVADESDPDFAIKVRDACNAENGPDVLPEGCMFPWCICNRYPARVNEKEDG